MAAELWTAGATGIEERADRLIAGFTDPVRAAWAATAVGGTVREVASTDGLDAWREHASVIVAGPFAVHPPWLTAPAGRIGLSIDAGHAFGSGSHPSTRLALQLLADSVDGGMRVGDIGCGSGVLSVAAARLGATVQAVDTDPAAVAATEANIAANRVDDRVAVASGSVEQLVGPVDAVVVNVTIDVHEALAAAIHALGPDLVLVSGVLSWQADRAVAAYGGRDLRRLADGEWVGLTVSR